MKVTHSIVLVNCTCVYRIIFIRLFIFHRFCLVVLFYCTLSRFAASFMLCLIRPAFLFHVASMKRLSQLATTLFSTCSWCCYSGLTICIGYFKRTYRSLFSCCSPCPLSIWELTFIWFLLLSPSLSLFLTTQICSNTHTFCTKRTSCSDLCLIECSEMKIKRILLLRVFNSRRKYKPFYNDFVSCSFYSYSHI